MSLTFICSNFHITFNCVTTHWYLETGTSSISWGDLCSLLVARGWKPGSLLWGGGTGNVYGRVGLISHNVPRGPQIPWIPGAWSLPVDIRLMNRVGASISPLPSCGPCIWWGWGRSSVAGGSRWWQRWSSGWRWWRFCPSVVAEKMRVERDGGITE